MTADTPHRADHDRTISAEPVLAEIVPQSSPPSRFGMRGLLALTAVCSVQFAFMNWFGVFAGLLLAITLCFLAFAGVFLVAVLIVRGDSIWLERLDQVGIRLIVAMVALIIASVLAGGGKIGVDAVADILIRRTMQSELGFHTERVYVLDQNIPLFALEVKKVESGGLADKAGLRQGDVIWVQDGRVEKFFHELIKQRGKDVSINVAGKAAHQPLENCPQWQLVLPIPQS